MAEKNQAFAQCPPQGVGEIRPKSPCGQIRRRFLAERPHTYAHGIFLGSRRVVLAHRRLQSGIHIFRGLNGSKSRWKFFQRVGAEQMEDAEGGRFML